MGRAQALKAFQSELHLSPSQVRTWLGCSLKYYFQYVAAIPVERTSIALPFGSAIHATLERHYRAVQERREPDSLATLQEFFEENLTGRLAGIQGPILFKKDTPTPEEALALGRRLLQTFHENVGTCLEGREVVAVELPLSAPLYDEHRSATELKLVGVVDLLLRDAQGRLLAVDHKTATKPMAQADVDEDLQLTAYAYLLAANQYVFPTAEVLCRFDVLRKLKTPKLEFAVTVRTRHHRRRFAKVATAVAAGIENRVFVPARSWLCSDCSFSGACARW